MSDLSERMYRTITLSTKYGSYTGVLQKRSYASTGNPSLSLVSPEEGPLVQVTTNIEEVYGSNDLVAIKNYSENENILPQLIEQGIVSEPVDTAFRQFVKIPICRLLWTNGQ